MSKTAISIGAYLLVGFVSGVIFSAISPGPRVPRPLAFFITLVAWPWVLWTFIRSGGD